MIEFSMQLTFSEKIVLSKFSIFDPLVRNFFFIRLKLFEVP